MKDDPESIRLREEHATLMRESGEMHDYLNEAETMAHVHPTRIVRLLLRFVRWAVGNHDDIVEEAKQQARKTYE
jgi:hypothetical protein